jgi:hypothetical protein
LPVFAANFKFTVLFAPPQLIALHIQNNLVILGLTNLTAGLFYYVEKSADLLTWQTIGNFAPGRVATNLFVDLATNSGAMYRLRVQP